MMKAKLTDVESTQHDYEQKCIALTYSLEENQEQADRANDQLIKEKKANLEYKNQLAVLSCQVTELKRYYSMERHVRKQLQAKLELVSF